MFSVVVTDGARDYRAVVVLLNPAARLEAGEAAVILTVRTRRRGEAAHLFRQLLMKRGREVHGGVILQLAISFVHCHGGEAIRATIGRLLVRCSGSVAVTQEAPLATFVRRRREGMNQGGRCALSHGLFCQIRFVAYPPTDQAVF